MRLIRGLVIALLACQAALARAEGDATTAGSAPVPAAEVAPATPQPDDTGVEFSWEIDPYYTDVGLRVPIDRRAVPDGGTMRERDVYAALFRESLHPRLLLLEASIYPMPLAGTWLKRNHRQTYDGFVIGDVGSNELNVIEGLTAGFQEPWALSAFIGGEMTFSRPDDVRRKRNHGYMGYLVSTGRKHIRDNVLIDDAWWEFEWKLKGERAFRDEQLDWSFRIGVKNHGNPDIRDVAYIGFRRSNLDFRQPVLSLLTNSSLEVLTEVARDNGNFMRQEVIFGKKVPIRPWRIAPTLEIGFIIEQDAKYTGMLADPTVDDLTFVFRPNIDW